MWLSSFPPDISESDAPHFQSLSLPGSLQPTMEAFRESPLMHVFNLQLSRTTSMVVNEVTSE